MRYISTIFVTACGLVLLAASWGGAPRPHSTPFELRVARGEVTGMTSVIIFGRNPDIDMAATEDIWGTGGSLTVLSSAETMEITSSSTSDDAAGTGALTVKVFGLDGSFDEISEVITMDGTSDVTTSNSYIRVSKMLVLTSGSGSVNAGAITATATSAATVQATMVAGMGITHKGHYTVPNGKTTYILKVELNAHQVTGGAAAVTFNAWLRQANGSKFVIVSKEFDTDTSSELEVNFPLMPAFTAQQDVWMEMTSSSNNVLGFSRFFLIEVDN